MTTPLVVRAFPQSSKRDLFAGLLTQFEQIPDFDNWISPALQLLQKQLNLSGVALVQGVKGQWRVLFQSGVIPELPIERLADVLDTESASQAEGWLAATIESPIEHGFLLVGFANNSTHQSVSVSEFDAAAAGVGLVAAYSNRLARWTNRAERLQALLDVTVKWDKSQDSESLLEAIAHTATRLLKAERATIFLIDRARNLLIGKPALGVEGGELLIPADAGVVGLAIRTGHPQRVDCDVAQEQALVHRDVDQKLQFQTRSLICVPIRDSQGRDLGAFELINKLSGNFDNEDEEALIELAAHAAIAIEHRRQVERLVTSKKRVADQAQKQVPWIGSSPVMTKLKQTIDRVADTDLAILITGENGTGKEVAAQMVHYLSGRRDQVLVAVNCAAITETLLESELFGHEKGAFTDAHQTRVGKFELADGGTLFLDEIGDMSLGGQAKLLRVLEEKVVVRVGGSVPIATNARVLAATNQNLAQLVREKKFREDLFFRLNVMAIEMPPLRERGEDILQLADYFLELFAVKVRRTTPRLTDAAKKRLLAHPWPGNVRELRNMMERLAYLTTEPMVDAIDLPFIDAPYGGASDDFLALDQSLASATEQFQADFINRHIAAARGNMTEAAKNMGLHRSNLYRKMKQLGLATDSLEP
jgi:transcriptional regulator with GAF, ATPase, and Fis domain